MTHRDPRRPTVQAKPIGDDPHAGQLAVVVSFRIEEPLDPKRVKASLGRNIPNIYGWEMHDLDVAVRVIGAAGEKSQHVQWPPGSARLRTEDDIQVVTTRESDTIDPGDKL